jgi:hypothetical protein
MKHVRSLLALVACTGSAIACSANLALAEETANYSGKYSIQQGNHASDKQSDSTLEVVQNRDRIEITRVEMGQRTTNSYSLDGSEADCTQPGGVPSRCKGQLKEEHLVLESITVTNPRWAPSRVHVRSRWQLSADNKTLTIKTDIDFPNLAPNMRLGLSPYSPQLAPYEPGTTKYARIETP